MWEVLITKPNSDMEKALTPSPISSSSTLENGNTESNMEKGNL